MREDFYDPQSSTFGNLSRPPTDDRSHIIERSMNRRSGEEERKQDFINLDESEYPCLSLNLDCLIRFVLITMTRLSQLRGNKFFKGREKSGNFILFEGKLTFEEKSGKIEII